MDYSYYEPSNDLEARVKAHKQYSELSLEEFLEAEFSLHGSNVLDLGCGAGNFTGILARSAREYIGVDKNTELLDKARQKHRKNKKITFLKADMDGPIYLPIEKWDYIFFLFSSYYTNRPKRLFEQCRDFLKKGGSMVLVGPSEGNATEIENYCLVMFGKQTSSSQRAGRIAAEFAPLLDDIGFNISVKSVNFDLNFPNYDEYFQYLSSTLQYREAFSLPFSEEKSRELLEEHFRLRLTKRISCVCATK